MSAKIDMKGKRFGKLFVLHEAESYIKPSGQKVTMWHCKCDCGNEVDVQANKLRSGHSTSCGCHRHEFRYKHGLAGTRLHKIWVGMIHRCYDSKTKGYENYGGRGICVCKEWFDDFMSFRNWSINNGYKDNLTIDRIDNDGNYEPTNCRWATQKEQQLNKRNTVYLTMNGVTRTIPEWSEVIGIKQATIRSRIAKGWSVEKTLKTPLMAIRN